MEIGKLLVKDVQRAEPDALLIDVARRMRDQGVGFLPVVEGEKLLGVITDRDIVLRAVAEGLDGAATAVRDIMSVEVVCCFDDETTEHAKSLMEEHGVRRLPVINRAHQLVGVLKMPDVHGSPTAHKTAVKVTFHREKTDSYGRPHKVPIKTVYITGAQDKEGAEASAVRVVEEESGTSWTNIATGMESKEEPDGRQRGQR